jgi:hypothetical protein
MGIVSAVQSNFFYFSHYWEENIGKCMQQLLNVQYHWGYFLLLLYDFFCTADFISKTTKFVENWLLFPNKIIWGPVQGQSNYIQQGIQDKIGNILW